MRETSLENLLSAGPRRRGKPVDQRIGRTIQGVRNGLSTGIENPSSPRAQNSRRRNDLHYAVTYIPHYRRMYLLR